MEEDIRLHRDTGTKTSARIEQRLEAAIEKASKRIKYDAAHDDEIIRALSVVEEFIKKKKRVCYGGTAMNALLPDSKKFYDLEYDLPDYDFYTPDPDGDVEDLVSILNKEGFKDVYQLDGGIVSFKATHPKWSYAKVNDDGFVSEVAEKKPISDNATVGIYFWKKGSDYVKYAEQMIEKNVRTNGEFYVCPVFNEAISDGKKVRIKDIERMWGIGTPEDLNYFLEHYKG